MRVGTRNIRKDLIIHSLSLRRRTVRGKSQRGKGKGVASVLFTAPERHRLRRRRLMLRAAHMICLDRRPLLGMGVMWWRCGM